MKAEFVRHGYKMETRGAEWIKYGATRRKSKGMAQDASRQRHTDPKSCQGGHTQAMSYSWRIEHGGQNRPKLIKTSIKEAFPCA